VLTFTPTSSLPEYLYPNYKSSVVSINSTTNTTLINDSISNQVYKFNQKTGVKAYISSKVGTIRLSASSGDGKVLIGTSYNEEDATIGLSNGFEIGSAGITAFKLNSDGSFQELGNYYDSSPCSWNNSTTCEKYSAGSIANDISSDSSTITGTLMMIDKGALSIGDLTNALGFEAFIWDENNGYKVLGSLSDSKMFSIANAVNSDGSIVAGTSEGNNGMEAFKWTLSAGMTGLGDLSGGEYYSSALDISNDGNKIVGFSSVGTDIYEAFKWTPEGGMKGLGRPSALESSLAMGISGDGKIVVGAMGNLENKNLNAFRWDEDNGMQKVTSWLANTGASVPSTLSLDIATSTNDDGNVIGGMSEGAAWLAFSGRGVIFPDTYTPTLVIPKISSQASFQLLDLTLNGSHHLPLKTMSKSNDRCFWANGDWLDKASRNTYSKLFEIGSCLDINADTRVGLGLGKGKSKKSIVNEVSSELNGNYLYSEVGTTPLDNKNIALSLSAFIGSWNSNITRYYLNSSVYDSSTGMPDISMTGFKVRADYMDLFNINGFSISPSIGLTRSNIETDTYLETGGGFPVKFDKQTQFRTVAKVGLRGEKDIQNVGRLRIMVDRSHETSRSNSNITGSVLGWTTFDIENNSSDNDSTNIALELDKRIDENSLVSTMVSFKSDDKKWNKSIAISYKYGF
jgi:probable HAF family extracellular repeat protein